MEVTAAVEALMSFAVVGAAVSALIQWMQVKFGPEGNETKVLAIVFSLIAGIVVWLLFETAYWTSVLGVFAAANTVYAMFFSGVRK